ncbi:PAS domain-containing protein [Myxococcota bacterium]|nr:PAS domain-containing protein [Myxococcota bacterium]
MTLPWRYRPRTQAWLGLGLGAALLSLLTGTHMVQERAFDRQRGQVEQIRQARLDLAEGFAQVSAAQGPGASFEERQGWALLVQASQALATATPPSPVGASRDTMVASAQALGRLLDAGPHPAVEPARHQLDLHLAVSRLTTDAARVDAAARQELRALDLQHQRVFRWTLALVGSVITGAAGMLYLSGSQAVRAEQARGRAERDRAGSEARERETARLLRALAEGVSEAVFVKDRDGRYLFLNRFALHFVGRTAEEVVGRTDDLLFGPQQGAALRELDARVMDGGGELSQEVELSSKGGTRTYLTTRAPFFDDDGRVAGTVGIATNISERKAMERALRTELDRLEHLAASAPGAVFSFRACDEGVACFPYASPRIEQLTGLSASDLARSASELAACFSPEVRASLRAALDASARDLQPLRIELPFQHPAQGEIWLEIHAAPSREPSGVVTWHGFMTDVSARHALEDALRQAQKMDAIGRLAGGIAHDFNNLLMVINAYAGMLRSGELTDPKAVEEASGAIFDAGERAAALTSQLLAFSRKAIVAPTELRLGERVRGSERLLRRLVGEDLRLETDLSPDDTAVRIDPARLDQVIVNLVVNARDAMPRGGTLRLSTRRVDLDQPGTASTGPFPAGTYVELAVQDAGVGMTSAVRAHLFEPFFTTKGQGRGTGLGLAVVHGILAQAGGHAVVESEPDVGTTVRVRLPAVAAPAPQVAVEPGPTPGGAERVLVVEDEHGVRRLVVQGLRRLGYAVQSTVDAEHALTLLQAGERFDALVTDMVLPGKSGADLAQAARVHLPDLRVLFMTGYSDDEVRRRGSFRPDDTLLRKPFELPVLARALRAALDGRPRDAAADPPPAHSR